IHSLQFSFIQCYRGPRYPHSFPTRRSSDLPVLGEKGNELFATLFLFADATEDAFDLRHGYRHEGCLIGGKEELGLEQLEQQVLDQLPLSSELSHQLGKDGGCRMNSHDTIVGQPPGGLSHRSLKPRMDRPMYDDRR